MKSIPAVTLPNGSIRPQGRVRCLLVNPDKRTVRYYCPERKREITVWADKVPAEVLATAGIDAQQAVKAAANGLR